jgi:IclR family acetate operon transcriptional repressor
MKSLAIQTQFQETCVMQKLPVPYRPPYMVSSVDKALRLIQMLRDHGKLRLKTASLELDVAESTVHRLMATLIFHGYAFQDESRAYLPGMALGEGPIKMSWAKELRDIAMPHIDLLSSRTGETINLVVRVGTRIHFIGSKEGNKVLRIVSRNGAVMRARNAAGGRILLAELSEASLRHLYQGQTAQAQNETINDSEFELFVRELRFHRRNGFATANQEIEDGVTAIAMPLRDIKGKAISAFSVSVPATRFKDLFSPSMMKLTRATREAIERDFTLLKEEPPV